MNDEKDKIFVSVIMPTYNEEKHLEECFVKVVNALKTLRKPFEIILEEDGSTDKTPEIMDRLAENHSYVKTLHFPKRMGKGFGIRRCFEVARGEYIVLIDSDMEYPPEKIPDLLDGINGNDIVVGSRSTWENMKNGNLKIIRAILSYVYNALLKILFGISFKDCQSGFKAFRRRIIESIQPLTSNGFEIDAEILVKAQNKGFKIGFIPITYSYKGNSKVDVLKDPLRMFISVLRWKLNGKFKEYKIEKS